MNDDILDHPYIAETPEAISMMQLIEREHPRVWVGQDKAVVERQSEEPEMHWSEKQALGYKPQPFEPTGWFDQDNSARSPLEADLDDLEEEDE